MSNSGTSQQSQGTMSKALPKQSTSLVMIFTKTSNGFVARQSTPLRPDLSSEADPKAHKTASHKGRVDMKWDAVEGLKLWESFWGEDGKALPGRKKIPERVAAFNQWRKENGYPENVLRSWPSMEQHKEALVKVYGTLTKFRFVVQSAPDADDNADDKANTPGLPDVIPADGTSSIGNSKSTYGTREVSLPSVNKRKASNDETGAQSHVAKRVRISRQGFRTDSDEEDVNGRYPFARRLEGFRWKYGDQMHYYIE